MKKYFLHFSLFKPSGVSSLLIIFFVFILSSCLKEGSSTSSDRPVLAIGVECGSHLCSSSFSKVYIGLYYKFGAENCEDILLSRLNQGTESFSASFLYYGVSDLQVVALNRVAVVNQWKNQNNTSVIPNENNLAVCALVDNNSNGLIDSSDIMGTAEEAYESGAELQSCNQTGPVDSCVADTFERLQ